MRLGISPRRFEGWEPQRSTTVTMLDDEGRPSGWSTHVESEWDAEDRAIVLALLDYEADLCGGCGQPLSESLHVEGRPDPVYENFTVTCMGCKAKERGEKVQEKQDDVVEKSGGVVFRAARKWVLRLKP